MLSIFKKWKDARKAEKELLSKIGDLMVTIEVTIEKLTLEEAKEIWERTLALTTTVKFMRKDSPVESPVGTTHLWRLLQEFKSIELYEHVISANLELGGYETAPGWTLISLGEDGEGWFARNDSETVFGDDVNSFDFNPNEENGLFYPSIYHAMLNDVLTSDMDLANKVLGLGLSV